MYSALADTWFVRANSMPAPAVQPTSVSLLPLTGVLEGGIGVPAFCFVCSVTSPNATPPLP